MFWGWWWRTVLKGVDERRAADGRYTYMRIIYSTQSVPFYYYYFAVGMCLYMHAHAHTYFVCMVAKPDRPTVCLDGQLAARTRVSVQCVCGPGRRDAHARSSLSPCDRKYFVDTGERGGGGGGIGRRPRWEGTRGALRLSLRRMRGEGCEPDSRRRRSRLSRRTPHAADHPSSPKHHSTHHPAPSLVYRHRRPTGRKIAFTTEQDYVYYYIIILCRTSPTRLRSSDVCPTRILQYRRDAFIRTSAVALANLRCPVRTTLTDRTSVWAPTLINA